MWFPPFITIYKTVHYVEAEISMSITFCKYIRSFRAYMGIHVHICDVYEVTMINDVPKMTLHILSKLHFILLAHITEEIAWSHYD